MAIPGQETIQVGAENQASGSDTIYDAFNKTANNFSKLFSCASPYTNFVAGNGISTTVTSSNGTVKIENTGVQSVQAGTGVTVLQQNGVVTISASGGNGQGGVTNVGISSSTLTVVNSPIISSGVMTVELPTMGVEPGMYTAPTISVDSYGRITEIANTTSIGTVTSIAVTTSGPGLSITGSPVLDEGTISITNTGVTRVNAGTGISLSGSNGNVTISATQTNTGTVTRVDVASNTLTVLNSPITKSGTITVEIPDNITLVGNLVSNTVTSNLLTINVSANVVGTATVGNLTTAGNITGSKLTIFGNANAGNVNTVTFNASGNITGGNITTAGILSVAGNVGVGANGKVTISNTTDSNVSLLGNTTSGGLVVAGGASIAKNLRVGNGVVTGNILASNVSANYLGLSGNIEWSMGTKIYTENYGSSIEIYSSGAGWSELNYGNKTYAFAESAGFGIETNATDIPNLHQWMFRTSGVSDFPGPLRLTPLSTAPTSPLKGTIYFDNNTNKLKVYTGSAWETITSA